MFSNGRVVHKQVDSTKPYDISEVDLVLTDPPYGIDGSMLDKHYARTGSVQGGYVDIPRREYQSFTDNWTAEAWRHLRPGGAFVVIVGHTPLCSLLRTPTLADEYLVNHMIWKYSFGVFTTKKFVTSHYHILFYRKPGPNQVFNTEARYGKTERSADGKSLLYKDLEDVFYIKKTYKTGQEDRNVNTLPSALPQKLIQYLSCEGDIVFDPFCGSGTIAKVALGLGRRAITHELSPEIYARFHEEILSAQNSRIQTREPIVSKLDNQGKPWTDADKIALVKGFVRLTDAGATKKEAIAQLEQELKRGRFAINNMLKHLGI